jgi:hypothetical protein
MRTMALTKVIGRLRKMCIMFQRTIPFFQSQRKAENESEVRRKAESLLQDLKRKLEEEQSKRTREMNNNQQVNDKINVLEKQVLQFWHQMMGL